MEELSLCVFRLSNELLDFEMDSVVYRYLVLKFVQLLKVMRFLVWIQVENRDKNEPQDLMVFEKVYPYLREFEDWMEFLELKEYSEYLEN